MKHNNNPNQEKIDNIKKYLKNTLTFMIYLSVPYTISLYLFTLIDEKFNLPKYHRIIYLFTFVLIVTAGSAVFTTLLDRLITKYKQFMTPKSKRKEPTKKTFSNFIIVNILIPACISLFIALIPISGNTIFARFITPVSSPGEYTFLPTITKAVTQSDKIQTKIEGINALKSTESDLALKELVKILNNNDSYLDNSQFYDELREALSSYNNRATSYLIDTFINCAKKIKSERKISTVALHKKYLESSFSRMKDLIQHQPFDIQTQKQLIIKIEKVELEVKKSLRGIEIEMPEISSKDGILNLILDAFVEMDDLKYDKEIYCFAREIITNNEYTDTTRGKAIELLCKQGSSDDFHIIIPLLSSPSDIIQSSALRGIRRLHERLKGIKEKETEVARITREID